MYHYISNHYAVKALYIVVIALAFPRKVTPRVNVCRRPPWSFCRVTDQRQITLMAGTSPNALFGKNAAYSLGR